MIHKFKFADLVKLISTGKKMYVTRLNFPGDKFKFDTKQNINFQEDYDCSWKEGSTVYRANFLEDTLELV
jgi:uncharacterized protein YodC (DUF2158 family)